MEIPKSNLYETAKTPRSIDFLNEKLKITFSFSEEAVDNLPEITDEDLRSGQERYRILLGKVNVINDSEINVEISGILEADQNEKGLFYEENIEEVAPNLHAIKNWVNHIQNSISEYKDFEFIGDIHTHPITDENNLDIDIDSCIPSDYNDIQDIIQEEKSNLLPNEPFIFGIAGRKKSDKTTSYAFYRLVKQNNEYSIEQIEKK